MLDFTVTIQIPAVDRLVDHLQQHYAGFQQVIDDATIKLTTSTDRLAAALASRSTTKGDSHGSTSS